VIGLDWLRRDPRQPASIDLGAVSLPVVVRRLAHARRMTLRLAPDGSEVRVSIPRWGRTAEALAFVQARGDWLARQLAALPRPAPPLAPGGSLAYRGEALRIEHAPGAPRRPRALGGTIQVGGPEVTVEGRLRRWLENEARRLIGEDLAHYCGRAGLAVPKYALSRARKRWGSCSSGSTVRINWRLVMAPDAVRRSVVAHEVAHLVHFDHSARFHALLDELFEGDLTMANRWLKRDGQGLYRQFG
jgi:predicted metal-dependent hydrolase